MFAVFTALRAALSGWKTIGIAVISLLCVAAEVGFGWDVPGFDPGPNWVEYVLTALGAITLRSGVGKPMARPIGAAPGQY